MPQPRMPDADEPLHLPIDGRLDLHTFQPRDVASVVEEYVRAAHDGGLREIRLIHGRGTGVQRGIVQAALEKHPLVEAFHDAPESHLGATIAILRRRSDS
jgi:DNA-nicking Smr family endonuclease